MKDNFIHVCFIVDNSGSMYTSVKDVVGGFKQVIDDQKKVKDGSCSVTLYTFNDKVKQVYRGIDINNVDVKNFEDTYQPGGMTAMNDGIGRAIDEVGEWLAEMDESERPSKNLIVIMTDGEENASKEYTLDTVKEKIKHQTEKYNWTFVYQCADITSTKEAKKLGISTTSFTSKLNYKKNYNAISNSVTSWRCATMDSADAVFCSTLKNETNKVTSEFEDEIGRKVTD